MKMNAEVKNHIPRSEHIYNEIRNAILYGFPGYLPGSVLSENKVAEFFGVSKTPAREALNWLRNEKLVEVIPYKGYLVANPTVKDLVDLFQLRLILETAAVELAVKNIRHEDIERLRNLTYQKNVYDEQDYKLNFRKINLEFHTEVAKISGNTLLGNNVKQTLEQMQRALFHDFAEEEIDTHHEEHRELVSALEDRNEELAVRLIKGQIELAKQRIFNYRNQQI